MGTLIELADTSTSNPLDVVEAFVDANEWSSERSDDDELTVGVAGKWCDFHLWISWREEIGALHFACVFDNRVAQERHRELHALLVLMNENLTVGHFDLWREEGMLLFRHALLLGRNAEIEIDQVETLFEIAFSECERFYPAVQFVLWGGKSAEEAAEAAMLECVGEA